MAPLFGQINQRALEPAPPLLRTIFVALLYPGNVNQKGKEKAVRNRTDLFQIVCIFNVWKMLNKREWLWKRNDIWCYLFICKIVETFVFFHMCNSALSKLVSNLLTGRVSVRNDFRPQARSNHSFISVHTHFILSTHSIPYLMPAILIHGAVTQWMS